MAPLKGYSQELFDLIKSMIQIDPERRPSAEEVLKHPQVNVRSKEKVFKEQYLAFKKKEHDIDKKEKSVR